MAAKKNISQRSGIETRYQAIFNALPTPIYTFRALADDFEFVDFNQAALNYSGSGLKKMIGQRALVFYPDMPEIIADFKQCIANKSSFDKEIVHRLRTTNELKVLHLKYSFAPPDLVVVQSAEITASRNAELMIRERNKNMAAFIENSPAALAMVDKNMCYLAVSNRWIEEYQLGGKAILGKSHYELFPEIGEDWKAIHQRCLTGIVDKREEDIFVRQDGKVEWLRWEIHPWQQETGEIGGLVMYTEVITPRKQVELDLKNSENRFHSLTDNAVVGIYILKEGSYSYVNAKMAEIFGYSTAEMLGMEPMAIVHKSSVGLVSASIAKRLSGEEIKAHYEFTGIRKNGEIIELEVFGTALDINGKRAIIGSLIDITERKAAEERIKRNAEKLTNILQNLPFGLSIETQDEKFTFFNDTLVEMLGYTLEDLPDEKRWSEIVFPDPVYREEIRKKWADLIKREHSPMGKSAPLQARLRCKDGSFKIVEGYRVALGNEYITVHQDVTTDMEREQYIQEINEHVHAQNLTLLEAKKKIEENEIRLKEAQKAAKVGSWQTDLETLEVNWSDETYAIFELDANSFSPTHESFLSFVHPDDVQIVDEAFRASFFNTGYNAVEHRIITARGNIKYVEERWKIVFNEQGKPISTFGTCQDITDRKKVEQELVATKRLAQENESRLLLAAEAAQLGIWDWSFDNNILLWDERTYEIHGLSKDNSGELYKNWEALLHAEDKERILSEIQLAIADDEKYDTTFRIIKPDGTLAYIQASGMVLRDAQGNPQRMIGMNSDITERVKSLEELQRLNQAKDERVKELNCLYRISELSRKPDCSMEEIFSLSVQILPTAYQFAEVCCARISFRESMYFSVDYLETPWQQSSPIFFKGEQVGEVAVFYKEAKPEEFEGSFLEEERLLINSVADILGNTAGFKESEITLHNSEEKYRYLFNNNPALIFIWDLEKLEVCEVNQRVIELYGYTREEFMGMPVFQYRPSEDHDKIRQFAERMLRGEEVKIKGIWTHLKKNGKEMIMEITSHKIEYQQRQAILSLGQDVTEQMKAEGAIRKNEEKHRALIENISDGIVMVDESFTIIYQSPSVERIVGYPVADRQGENITEFIHPDDLQLALENYIEARANPGVAINGQYRTRHKNGKIIWLEVAIMNLLHVSSVQAYVVIYRDVTERKNFEEQLALASLIVNSSDDAIISKNMAGTITSWNAGAERVLGYSAAEAVGKASKILVPPGLSKEDKMIMDNIRNKQSVDHFETRRIRKDRVVIDVSLTISPIMDDNGEVIGASKIMRDITKQKVLETERNKIINELVQRNRDLEQFAYIISHNLRAPVANILGINGLILEPEIDQTTKEQLIAAMNTSVEALDGVIKDLNNILQIKREINEQKTNVRFSDLLENIKLSIGSLIQSFNVQFEVDFLEVDEWVTIKSYLYSIFYNLISNSIKYKQPQQAPVIQISSKLTSNGVMLVFKDNGLGIDLKKKGDQVFGLYKRFHFHTEGKGVGLFMVKTQVEALGGNIVVHSEVNKGTEFIIELYN